MDGKLVNVADFSKPGRVVNFDLSTGKTTWEYFIASGDRMLDHPSPTFGAGIDSSALQAKTAPVAAADSARWGSELHAHALGARSVLARVLALGPVLALSLAMGAPMSLNAAPVFVELGNYVSSAGRRADYFQGKLLTKDDLGNDQDYKRGTGRHLGDPAEVLDDASLTLDDLFAAAGRVNIRLSFDCAHIDCAEFVEPVLLQDPHHDDMVFLNVDQGTWFGQLYLRDVDGLSTGVYRTLSGSFDRYVGVPEPASAALAGLALLGMFMLSRLARQ